MDLCKLALLGLTLGLTTNAIQASENTSSNTVSHQALANGGDHYVCSSYQNCGKCGGSCNFKNPNTPGLTPEEKKKAEEFQKENEKEKGSTQETPSAPGKEKCGTFCASISGNSDSSSDNSSAMKVKRQSLRNN